MIYKVNTKSCTLTIVVALKQVRKKNPKLVITFKNTIITSEVNNKEIKQIFGKYKTNLRNTHNYLDNREILNKFTCLG